MRVFISKIAAAAARTNAHADAASSLSSHGNDSRVCLRPKFPKTTTARRTNTHETLLN